MIGMLLTILYWVCFAWIIVWAVNAKRTGGERIFAFGLLGVSLLLDFLTGFGWVIVFLYGGLCWADARAGGTI